MIRRFTFSDLDDILDIERHAFPKSPYSWATFVNLQWLYPETFLVYVEEGSPSRESSLQGYIIFSQDGHILSIAVHPEHRKKGIGKELIDRVLGIPQVRKVWAEVRKSNQSAQAFYLRLGFRFVAVVPKYYGEEDALIVEKNASHTQPSDH
jgi:[ribosomal protein S18]-alanine N-acetyltransferase